MTGASGYIGSMLTRRLLEDSGVSVLAIDVGWFGDTLPPESDRLVKLPVDIRNLEAKHLNGCNVVIHLAAVANDPSATLNSALTWEVGAYGTHRVCLASNSAGVETFILASSGSVYGVRPEARVVESTPLTPISTYNRVKMAKERIVLSFSESMRVVIFRPATVCGVSPRQRLDLSVNTLVMDAMDKGLIRVLGGEQVRPHLTLQDMVLAYEWAIRNTQVRGVYNIGFRNLTMDNLAALVSERTGARIVHEESNDPRSYRLSSDKILDAGFSPTYEVEDAIEDLIVAFESGMLLRTPNSMNVEWMSSLGLGDRVEAFD